jgi:hypothetical protein
MLKADQWFTLPPEVRGIAEQAARQAIKDWEDTQEKRQSSG